MRERYIEGPPGPGEDPTDVVVVARRYLCQPCGAVLLVVPRGVMPRRRYTAAAIAFALALWGWAKRSVAEVRRRTSTTPAPAGFGDRRRWASLRRWVAAAMRGVLFARLLQPRPPAGQSARAIAEQVAIVLAAHALPSLRHLPLPAQAFHGGGQMA